MKYCITVACCTLLLGACTSASNHLQQVRSDEGNRVTVGTVQKEIRVGMTSGQVVEALGSPNIVTTDEDRREQWIYDKIATESVSSSSAAEGGAIGVLSLIGGGLAGNKNASAKSTSQRTFTVIVKFDNESRVRDFAYHSSSF